MNEVISIHEAKTNISKLVKKAKAGQTIYNGAYGKPEVIISSMPLKKQVKFGILAHKAKSNAYNYEDLVNPDKKLKSLFESSDSTLDTKYAK